MRFKPALNIIFGITTEILYSLFIILTAFLFCLAIYFGIGKYKILSYTVGVGSEGVQAPLPRGDSERSERQRGVSPYEQENSEVIPKEFSCKS